MGVSFIDVWYDGISNNWVAQVKDAEGNQIGEAVYVYRKWEAVDSAESLRPNSSVPIKIYKRDGSFQKEI